MQQIPSECFQHFENYLYLLVLCECQNKPFAGTTLSGWSLQWTSDAAGGEAIRSLLYSYWDKWQDELRVMNEWGRFCKEVAMACLRY
jgi:hypothetical protein